MVSKKTLLDIVKKLMVHMEKAEGTSYRDELLAKIIQICSQSNYQFITNFEWWVYQVNRTFEKVLLKVMKNSKITDSFIKVLCYL